MDINTVITSANKDWFRFSKDTQTWSRVLVRGGKEQGFLKEISIDIVQLLPIEKYQILNTESKSINVYTPNRKENVTYTHSLPLNIYRAIVRDTNPKLACWLLDDDIMRNINIYHLANTNREVIDYNSVRFSSRINLHWMEDFKNERTFYTVPDKLVEVHDNKIKEKMEKLATKFNTH